jgi:hypothetical protein
MKVKGEHVVVGVLGITAAVAGALYLKKHHKLAFAAKARHNPRTPGMQYRSRLAYGKTEKNSGIANVGIDAGGVGGWTAAGYKAHLDPSAWSYLTQRNENYTYAHTPTNRLLKPALLGTNAQHKVQGAMGMTYYPWQAVYTYW